MGICQPLLIRGLSVPTGGGGSSVVCAALVHLSLHLWPRSAAHGPWAYRIWGPETCSLGEGASRGSVVMPPWSCSGQCGASGGSQMPRRPSDPQRPAGPYLGVWASVSKLLGRGEIQIQPSRPAPTPAPWGQPAVPIPGLASVLVEDLPEPLHPPKLAALFQIRKAEKEGRKEGGRRERRHIPVCFGEPLPLPLYLHSVAQMYFVQRSSGRGGRQGTPTFQHMDKVPGWAYEEWKGNMAGNSFL